MSIASEITRLQTAKANIKTAIINKGGTIDDETLDQYASVIDTISTGTDISDANALVGDVLINKTFYATSGGKKTGTMADNGTVNTDITTKAQEVTIAGGKHSGSGKVKISSTEQAKIVADNIKSGVSILGQAGSLTPAKAEETKTITSPDFSSGNIEVTPTTDKVMTKVTINKDTTNHIPENIKDGITLYGIAGTYEGGGVTPIDFGDFMAIGTGYNFKGEFVNDEASLEFSFLGKKPDGSYGWFSAWGDDITYTNVSFVVITYITGQYNFRSITQNALYTLDGTAINNHSSIVNAVGKLCYLVKDCHISYSDD